MGAGAQPQLGPLRAVAAFRLFWFDLVPELARIGGSSAGHFG